MKRADDDAAPQCRSLDDVEAAERTRFSRDVRHARAPWPCLDVRSERPEVFAEAPDFVPAAHRSSVAEGVEPRLERCVEAMKRLYDATVRVDRQARVGERQRLLQTRVHGRGGVAHGRREGHLGGARCGPRLVIDGRTSHGRHDVERRGELRFMRRESMTMRAGDVEPRRSSASRLTLDAWWAFVHGAGARRTTSMQSWLGISSLRSEGSTARRRCRSHPLRLEDARKRGQHPSTLVTRQVATLHDAARGRTGGASSSAALSSSARCASSSSTPAGR